jgi:AT-rich interactive domain-containing protein 1
MKDLRTEHPRKAPRKEGSQADNAVSPGKKNKRRMLEGWVIPTKEKVEKEKGEDKNKHCDKNSTPTPVIKEEKEAPLSAVKTEKEEAVEKVEVEEDKDPLEVIRERTGIVVKSGAGFESRWSSTVLEEENFLPDCASLNLVQESQDNLGKRAVVVSTIFRNLSFVPGNETILSSSPGFLAVCGKMLLYHHWHPPRTSKQRNYDRGEEEDFTDSCTSLGDQPEWWWEHLQVSHRLQLLVLFNALSMPSLSPRRSSGRT